MPGCATRCTTYRTDNRNNAWLDIRSHFGPISQIGSTVYTRDIDEWTSWAVANGKDPVSDVTAFGNWLIWRCGIGTVNYGNLPSRIRDHEGISCIPCPYSTAPPGYDQSLWDARSEMWTGSVPASYEDHGEYYMKVSQDGNSWGFRCTYSGCPYQDANGKPFFYV